MYYLPFAWLRRNSCFLVITGLASLAMGGCPQVRPGGGNGNEPPPGQDLTVDMTYKGEGTVTQVADGNMVTLTAVHADGWIFNGWSDAQVADQTAETITVDATEVPSITANFIEDPGPPRPLNVCGDGVVDRNEQCDDGNTVDGDGCSSTCQIETPTPPECGDGVKNGSEQCDTGGESTTCNVNCTTSRCGDGVKNVHAGEQCDDENTVNGDGCSSSCRNETTPPSGCGDGVKNGTEQCDTGGESATCNDNCTASLCGDGIVNTHAGELCDDGNTVNGDGCSTTCQTETGGGGGGGGGGGTTPVCGNNVIETGEQCDDGNTAPGDGCGATCQNEAGGISNELCSAPIAVTDGTLTYSNVGATTDGPNEPVTCVFEFGNTNVDADIWYCYTATCTGTAMASLCGSDYDTRLAVYAGCGCPTAAPLDCSDDDCGTGVGNVQSRVVFSATAGQSYMVRVGGYLGAQGNGKLTIGCNVDACANGTGSCTEAKVEPGCSDATCCGKTCAVDQFCCDVTWDATCAGEAEGVCDGSFQACGPGSGECGIPDGTPGCDNVSCCNKVCLVDPYCCLTEWDSLPSPEQGCVERAKSLCLLTCGPGGGGGGCHSVNATPGCDSLTCCEAVCAVDHFCCDTEWDQTCVDAAAGLPACPP